jgi:ubiquinone/menaquinone biosynthesis C-methylase UbiE/pimeloyl-ACP methyl ester carboxylesterase
MSDRRKNIRISHQDSIRFEGDGGVAEARSVDISRTGMQVVVDLPGSDADLRTITFTLPNSDAPVRIPVRITREESGEEEEGYRLGLEFQFEAAEQMRLIDRYIREQKEQEIRHGDRAQEARQIPRCDCDISPVHTDHPDARPARIANISTEGLLLELDGRLEAGESLELSFTLPGERRKTTVYGDVVYVVQEGFLDRSVAGVQFTRVREVDRARMRNFIVGATSSTSVRSVHLRMEEDAGGGGFTITDPAQLRRILLDTRDTARPMHILFGEERRIRTAQLASIEDAGTLRLEAQEEPGEDLPEGCAAYVSFHHQRGSYLFTSHLIGTDGNALLLAQPERLYRTEKRSYQRKNLERPRGVRFSNGTVATLLDISWRGFLCTLTLPAGAELPFRQGDSVSYTVDEDLGLDSFGQIRHVSLTEAEGGSREVQIGVESGVRRSSYRFTRIDEERWEYQERFATEETVEDISFESTPITIRNDEGKAIVALLNTTGSAKAPVVLIPPAFGKKKETLAPLVATLLSNAAEAGVELATLRFDGINRPGESHNENPQRARGYEMLHYRPRQGVADIEAVLDYIYDNPYFQPEGVALFTSSMSSVDARKFLSRKNRDRVHAWVSLMGVPAARTTLTNILAGTDIIANARMGISNGIRGMLGHLVDMDLLARDLIDEKYAYLTDARYEMARIKLPILWIYGAHDRWVESEEVADLMSIDGGAPRELVEIPTGHNLRGSRDAIEAFKLACRFIFRQLHGIEIDPVSPPREATVEMVARERERLEDTQVPEMTSYWHTYLMGNERNQEGYDFYRNFAAFREFMQFQVELLGPEEGESVADIGCGTGVVSEAILQLGAAGVVPIPGRLVAVDLVPEALEKARRKCELLQMSHRELRGCRLEFVQRNLEPNRLLPIKEFVESENRDLEILRNRVEGLTSRHIEAIRKVLTPEVEAVLTGGPVSPELAKRLEEELQPAELDVLLDLKDIARYLSENGRGEQNMPSPKRLKLNHFNKEMRLGFASDSFDRVVASLFISYIFNPEYLLADLREMLKPGGTIVVSSMRPDSDVSTIFTEYVSEVNASDKGGRHKLEGAQAILSEAAGLFELEEEGYFHFYTSEELHSLLEGAGFVEVETFRSLGDPPQAVVARGHAP